MNVLIGVGLLADPLAFADAGWVFGCILLLFCCLVTNCTCSVLRLFLESCAQRLILSATDTAKMLAAMMRQDRTSATYADVLIHAYGSWTRPCIYALFLIELVTFSVATVTLFADSMSSLFPKFSPFFFKLLAYVM